MFSWLFSYTFFSGPARNAPNDGVNIREVLSKVSVSGPSQEVVVETLNKLKKVEVNKDRPQFYRSPLLRELDEVFKKEKYLKSIDETVRVPKPLKDLIEFE